MRKRMIPKIVVLIILVLSIIVTSSVPFFTVSAEAEGTDATFYNVPTAVAADPHVLYDKASGYYYAYSTAGNKSGYRFGILPVG